MDKQLKPKAAPIAPITKRTEVAVIAVARKDGTWTAIKSDEYADFHYILANGESLPEGLAFLLFPEFAALGLTYKE